MKIVQTLSPNFSFTQEKKIGAQIHKTLGLMPGTLEWLKNPKSQASAHYLIQKQGPVLQLVRIKDRSWSSGRISHPSKRGLNLMKIGGLGNKPGEYLIQFEVECLEHETYSEKQYNDIVYVLQMLEKKLDIKFEDWNTITHQDTAIYKPNLEKERLTILRRLNGGAILWKLQMQLKILQLQLLLQKLLGMK